MTEPLRQGTLPTLEPGRHLAAAFEADVAALPYGTITVVGSKGKGTTSIAASAALAAAGLCVGTITSPSLRTARERIRVDGRSINPEHYIALADDLADLYAATRAEHPDWVLPGLGGRSLLAGLRHFADVRADVAVLEASMGGACDLTHIVPSPVVVITEVFAEHVGSLGNNLAEIAVEKLGALTEHTQVLVTVNQDPAVWDAWHATGRLDDVDVIVVGFGPYGHHDSAIVDRNLELGRVAAHAWRTRYDEQAGDTTLPDVLRLPGRCHELPDAVMVDCAISAAGAAAVLDQYGLVNNALPTHVYVMLPRSKDDTGVRDILTGAGVDFTPVAMPHLPEHLHPDTSLWGELTPFADIDFAGTGRFLAFGTVSFAAAVLNALDADTDTLW